MNLSMFDVIAASERRQGKSAGLRGLGTGAIDRYWEAKVAANEAKYGPTYSEIADGVTAVEDAFRGGLTADEAIDLTCRLADSFGAGGVCRAMMQAINAMFGWLAELWPATPRYVWPIAYRRMANQLGYRTGGRTEDQAVAVMFNDGWIVDLAWSDRGTPPPIPIFWALYSKRCVADDRERSQFEADRHRIVYGPLTGSALEREADAAFPDGRSRYEAIMRSPDGMQQMTFTWGNPYRVIAYKLNALPEDMRRAVLASLLATLEELPCDFGVKRLVGIIRGNPDTGMGGGTMLSYATKQAGKRPARRFERGGPVTLPGTVYGIKPKPKGWSTAKKVAVGTAVVGVPTGGYFLGRALGWWK